MQELEKILEEIDNLVYFYDNADEPMMYVEAVKDIIRKYMENDGWISVDEQLPDNNEDILVTTDVVLITFGYLLNGKWITDQEPDYPIAWRPLPEPYCPERSNNHDGK